MQSTDSGPDKAVNTKVEKECRRSCRYPATGFVEFLSCGSLSRGQLKNVSRTGCLVLTKSRIALELLSTVELRFTIARSHFVVDAKVVRIHPGEFVGFEFVSLDRKLQFRLEAICKNALDGNASAAASKNE